MMCYVALGFLRLASKFGRVCDVCGHICTLSTSSVMNASLLFIARGQSKASVELQTLSLCEVLAVSPAVTTSLRHRVARKLEVAKHTKQMSRVESMLFFGPVFAPVVGEERSTKHILELKILKDGTC